MLDLADKHFKVGIISTPNELKKKTIFKKIKEKYDNEDSTNRNSQQRSKYFL